MPLPTACRQLFGIELRPEHVWELDSSQPNKFSRHIVVCLPRAAFACSATVGAFVAQLLARHEVSSGGVNAMYLQVPSLSSFWLLCTGGDISVMLAQAACVFEASDGAVDACRHGY